MMPKSITFIRTTHTPNGTYLGDQSFRLRPNVDSIYVHLLSNEPMTFDQIVEAAANYNKLYHGIDAVICLDANHIALQLIRLAEAGLISILDSVALGQTERSLSPIESVMSVMALVEASDGA